MSQLETLAETGRMVLMQSMDTLVRSINESAAEIGSSESERNGVLWTLTFCNDWVDQGCQVYEIQHSMAALLAATRAPTMESRFLPHKVFVVKVPSAFLPVIGNTSPDVLISVVGTPGSISVGLSSDSLQSISWMFTIDGSIAESDSTEDEDKSRRREWLLAIRMVSNVVAFITEHRECVRQTTKIGSQRTVHVVSAPRDVVIDRAFRDRVSTLVRAGTQSEVRAALAHMVRGHWRNQPVGEGRAERRLTWVRPHRRGDESLGLVVSRTERVHAV